MPIVQIPNIGDVEFPDSMTPEQIAAAIEGDILGASPAQTEDQHGYDPNEWSSDQVEKNAAEARARQAAEKGSVTALREGLGPMTRGAYADRAATPQAAPLAFAGAQPGGDFAAAPNPAAREQALAVENEKGALAAGENGRGMHDWIRDGAIQLVTGTKQILGAPAGLVAPDSQLARDQKASAQRTASQVSEASRGAILASEKRIQKAAEEGNWAEFKMALAEVSTNPALFQKITMETLPSMLGVLAPAKAAQLAAILRGASPTAAAAVGVEAAGLANAILNGGSARQEGYDSIYQALLKQGVPEAEARQRALNESVLGGLFGAATGYVGGRFGAEAAFVNPVTRGAAGKAAAGVAARELGTEQLEEVLPQAITQGQVSQIDGSDPTKGLAQTSVQTLVGTGPMAAVGAAGTLTADTADQALSREIDASSFAQPADQVAAARLDPSNAQLAARPAPAGEADNLGQTQNAEILDIEQSVYGGDAALEQAVAGQEQAALSGAARAVQPQEPAPLGVTVPQAMPGPNGSLAIAGNPTELQGLLSSLGVTQVLPARDGIVVGRSDAGRIADALKPGGTIQQDLRNVHSLARQQLGDEYSPGDVYVTRASALPDTADPVQPGKGTTRSAASLVEAVSRAVGIRPVFFASRSGKLTADGAIFPGTENTIYINTDRGFSFLSVLTHETEHLVQQQTPKAHAAFREAIAAAVDTSDTAMLYLAAEHLGFAPTSEMLANPGAALDRMLSASGKNRQWLDNEFSSDLVGFASRQKGFWPRFFRELGRRDVGLLKRVANAFRQFSDAAKQEVGSGQNFGQVQRMIKDLDAVVRESAKALAEFSANQGKTDAAPKQGNTETQAAPATRTGDVGEGRGGQQAGGEPALSPDRTLTKENTVSVVVGGKPGEYGWTPAARMAAAKLDSTTDPKKLATEAAVPPFMGPTQYKPNLETMGRLVGKVLSAKTARDTIAQITGAKITGVAPIVGTWEQKVEPSFVLTGDMTYDEAGEVSRLLGFAFAQDATIATQPWFEETDDQIPGLLLSQGKPLTEEQLDKLVAATKREGLDFSLTVDRRGAKFLHFGDQAEMAELGAQLARIRDEVGLKDLTPFYTRSELHEASTYFQGRVGENLREDGADAGAGRPSDLFRRTVDHLLVPYAKAVAAEGYRFSPERFGDRFGLTEAETDYIRAALRPRRGKLLSTVPLVTGQEKLNPPRTSSKKAKDGGPAVTKSDLLWALQNRTAQIGQIEPTDRSDEARRVIAEAIADELIYNLGLEEGKSAVGWYDRALHDAKSEYERVFPELRTDRDREMLFDAVLGVTSQGNDVHSNALFAGRVYFLMTRRGQSLGEAVKTLKGTFGKQTVAIEGNLLKLEHLLNVNGYDAARKFFNTRGTVSEIRAILKNDEKLFGPDGTPLDVEGQADQKITGWMVFGPKIGSFINNLHGDFSTLTADLWFSRTWNRMLGYVFRQNPDLQTAQYVKIYRAMLEEVRTGKGRDLVGKTEADVDAIAATPEELITFAREVHALREKEYKDLRNDAVTPLRQAAKALVENMTFAQEAPRGDTERAMQQDVMERAQQTVRRKTGINLTIADGQAVLWYHEKNMFRGYGVGDSKAEAADYVDAAKRFTSRFEEGDLFFVEKPKPRYVVGEKGGYLGGGPITSPGNRTITVDGVERPTTNSEGRPIHPTEEGVRNFWRWFGDSKVVDEQGRPLVVYHGTDGQDFSMFQRGAWFSADPEEASAYSFWQDAVRRDRGSKKYRIGSAANEFDGRTFEYFGVPSDIDRPENGQVYATDQGVVRYLGKGQWEVFDDLVLDYGSVEGDVGKVRKGNARSAARRLARGQLRYLAESLPEGASGRVYPAYLSLQNPADLGAFQANRLSSRLGKSKKEMLSDIKRLRDQGFDGISTVSDEVSMFSAEFGGREAPKQFVAFDPTQIKSATGNAGTFDATNPDIRFSPGQRRLLTAAWTRLAEDPSVFRYPTSQADTLEGVLAEIAPSIKASKRQPDEREKKRGVTGKWQLTMPDGAQATVYRKRDIVTKGRDEIWVNASKLKSGQSRGTALYAALLNWAHNSEGVMVGDPLGVSDIAIVRRTENMISSALKFGTTEHMRPAKEQENPGLFEGTMGHTDGTVGRLKPLAWKEGDDLGNLARMLEVSYAHIREFVPEIEEIQYDFTTGEFRRRSDDREVAGNDWKRWAGALAKLLDPSGNVGAIHTGAAGTVSPLGARASEGRSTLQRGAITASLLRRAGEEDEGRSVLAELGEQLSGGVKQPGILYSPARFISPLRGAVAAAKTDTQPAKQWALWLASNAPKAGVKAEEIEWSGVKEWLELQGKAKVTKDQVLEFIDGNGIRVEEVRMSEVGPTVAQVAADPELFDAHYHGKYTFDEFPNEQERLEMLSNYFGKGADEHFEVNNNAPTYGGYRTSGGENYRELLLKLPEQVVRNPEYEAIREQWIKATVERDDIAMMRLSNRLQDMRPYTSQRFLDDDSAFRSAHWAGHPNVLLHLRMDDRTTADGGRVLFVQELQSDWGQEGRSKGFRSGVLSRAESLRRQEDIFRRFDSGELSREQRNAALADLSVARDDAQHTPRAPFVTSTEAWVDLGIKQALLEAVNGGYDQLAFVTGEQAAEMFSLDKQVRQISWNPDTLNFHASNLDGGEGVDRSNVTRDDIPDLVGKEIAERLLSNPKPNGTYFLRGDDLKVEAKGMRKFYGEIVPQRAKALAKKLGGRVGSTRLEGSASYQDLIAAGARTGLSQAELDAMPVPQRKALVDGQLPQQFAIEITPGLREKAAKGLPLFSPGNRIRPPANPQQSFTPPPIAPRRLAKVPSLEEVRFQLQDKLIDLKRIQEAITASGRAIRDQFDPYLLEETYHGRAAHRVQVFLETEVEPVLGLIKGAGLTVPEVEEFLHARHAKERNEVMAAINPNAAELQQRIADAEVDVQDATADLALARQQGGNVWPLEQKLARALAMLRHLQQARPFAGTEAERNMLSGMSTADAADLLRDARRSPKWPVLKRIGEKIDEITAQTRAEMAAYGVEAGDTIAAMETAYDHYVPLQREMDDADLLGTGGTGQGAGFSIRGSQVKRATGSLRNVEHILANLVARRETAIVRGEKNRVAKALYGLVLENPNPDLWAVVKPGMSKTQLKQELQAMGVDPALIDTLVAAPSAPAINAQTGLVERRVSPLYASLPNAFVLRVNGEDRVILFSNADDRAIRLVKSLKNDTSDLAWAPPVQLVAQIAPVTRYLAAVNTQYNPVFGLTNWTRDVQGAALNLTTTPLNGKQAQVLGSIWQAFRGIWNYERGDRSHPWAKHYDDFLNEGGATGFRDMFNGLEDRARELQALMNGRPFRDAPGIKQLLDLLSDYNTAIENSTRLAAYVIARQQGMSQPRAASLAKNLTVNFNRKGASGTFLSGLYMFFNAAVQGTERTLRTLTGQNGKAILLAGVGLGVLQTVIGVAAMGLDDWESIPEHERARHFIFPTGDGEYYKLPMTLGFHVLPNLGRVLTEMAIFRTKPAERLLGLLTTTMDAFNPLGSGSLAEIGAPTILDPLIQLGANKDGFGRPIYREDMSSLDPSPGFTRARAGTSSAMVGTSEFFNWVTGGTDATPGWFSPTPEALSFVAGTLTGGVGREALKLWTYGEKKLTGDEVPRYQVPVGSRFMGETRGAMAVQQRYYDVVREVNIAENEFLSRAKAGQDTRDYDTLMALSRSSRKIQAAVSAKGKERKSETDPERRKALDQEITALQQILIDRVAEAKAEQ